MSILILQLCQILFYSKTTTYAPETTNFKQTGNIPEYTTVTFYHESTEQIQNENENMGEIVLIATLVGVLILIFSFCTLFIYVRKSKCYILNVHCTSC